MCNLVRCLYDCNHIETKTQICSKAKDVPITQRKSTCISGLETKGKHWPLRGGKFCSMCKMPALQGYWQRLVKRKEAQGNLKKRKAEEELQTKEDEDEDEVQIELLCEEEMGSGGLEDEIQIELLREQRET